MEYDKADLARRLSGILFILMAVFIVGAGYIIDIDKFLWGYICGLLVMGGLTLMSR